MNVSNERKRNYSRENEAQVIPEKEERDKDEVNIPNVSETSESEL